MSFRGPSTCAICFLDVDTRTSAETIAPSCCKNAWFHRSCLQRYAISAGKYYFKCPICNCSKKFQKEMLNVGIYIPVQDASWERQPDAYSELLERYSVCDAAKCLCPQGRNYDAEKGKFDLILCEVCGSYGTHVACKGLLQSGSSLVCPICIDDTVTTRSTTSNTPERDSQRRRSHTNDSDCEDRLVFWSGQRSPTSISTRSNVDTDRSQSSPFNRNFGAVLVLESASLSHESLFNTRLRRGNSSEQAVEYVSVENVLDSDGLDQSGISLRSRNRSRSRLRRTDYSEYRNSRSCANDDDVQGHRSGLRCSSISNFDSNRSSVSNPHLDSVTQGHRSGLRSYSISNSGSSGSFGDSHLKCANRYIRLMHCDLNGKKWTD